MYKLPRFMNHSYFGFLYFIIFFKSDNVKPFESKIYLIDLCLQHLSILISGSISCQWDVHIQIQSTDHVLYITSTQYFYLVWHPNSTLDVWLNNVRYCTSYLHWGIPIRITSYSQLPFLFSLFNLEQLLSLKN